MKTLVLILHPIIVTYISPASVHFYTPATNFKFGATKLGTHLG